MRAGFVRTGLVCLGVLLGAAAPRAVPTVLEPDPEDLRGAVVHRVIDGDSVELFVEGRVERYELAGADAPDAVHPDRPTIPGAERARLVLALMIEGERLMVMDDPRRATDALGRRRGYLFRAPEMTLVNLEMVRLGLARHARIDRAWNGRAFLWAQDQARSSGKGVWDPALSATQREEPKPKPDPEPEPEPNATDEGEQDAEQAPAPEPDADVVYVTRSGSKYHRVGCRHLTDSAAERSRSEVASTHEPCKVCEPDED